ncbi:CAP domain-containing protein [Pedobacter frigidisoli]|uniref:CAP domain-containing protein n=1 Tax=Pedobacter frigidisoli TaxID=2530455 RepID=A0A4R0NYK6_9SPHI|nr:CAP domain-containing protein [Pedobacter frigidisoli]TCD07137.1 CAP domain-containing protein [Pedobacter frigidisoli]
MKFIFVPMMCIALCCAISCKKGTDSSVTSPILSPEITNATNINNDALLKLVNDTRLAGCNCGTTAMPPVAALTWNVNLASVAIGHSKYMASIKTLKHESADGKMVGDRVKPVYNWVAVGENIAAGQTTEAQVVNDWIKSESHCKVLMSANYKEMGAAKTDTYWVQIFAAK